MDGLPNAPQIPMPQVPLSPKPFLKTPLGLILIAVGVIALIVAALFGLKSLNLNLPSFPGKPEQTINQVQPPQILDPKVLFNKTIASILTKPMLPTKLENIRKEQDQTTRDSFFMSWKTKSSISTISGTMTASTPSQISSLSLSFLYINEASASTEVAQRIIPEFFSVTPRGTWGCKPIQNITYCENFWEENKIKRGISVQSPISTEQTGISVGFCEFHQNTDVYSWKSCTSEFAETGINEAL